MSDTNMRLNYAAKAIPDLRRQAEAMKANGASASAAMMYRTVEIIDQSVKFILPDGGWLFEFEGFKETDLQLFHPPYESVLCEYFVSSEEGNTDLTLPVPQRIALASDFSMWDDLLAIPDAFEENGGVVISSIFYHPWSGLWQCTPFMLGAPKSPDPRYISKEAKASARDKVKESGFNLKPTKTGVGYDASVFILGEYGEKMLSAIKRSGGDPFIHIKNDLNSEEVAIFQLFASLNCENVSHQTLQAPKSLQKKRSKKGKHPLFEYKVLDVSVPKNKATHSYSGEGDRNSPRVHLRRGHIRRTPNGKAVWVQPHVVGDKDQGVIHKDYHISPKTP